MQGKQLKRGPSHPPAVKQRQDLARQMVNSSDAPHHSCVLGGSQLRGMERQGVEKEEFLQTLGLEDWVLTREGNSAKLEHTGTVSVGNSDKGHNLGN